MSDLQIVTIVAETGVGKTTLIESLTGENEPFRVLSSVTTRRERPTDLQHEYRYLSPEVFGELAATPGRLLWNVSAGNGDRYAKDMLDVMEALVDDEHVYLNALIPSSAKELVQRYGSEVVKTVFLQPPEQSELRRRLLERDADNVEQIEQRLTREKQEDWLGQLADTEGLIVITNQDLLGRQKAIQDLVG